ncbi:YhjD/YihY/BrkB family envelope integrity protein [Halorhabdus amylolytica]|uniref:YhjD/YihY/BrkB family envelope integrity protein n=1 Tax=Halorhabdus amylolytica TaxID=2559573 RepID=UPI0010AA6580|nr:YhjD/YihY/BrkB family envelope integrity protein [Halorhabdus amylolytica]
MASTARTIFGTGREVVGLTLSSRLSFLAAATAYYAFVSVFPLALLVVAVGSFVGGDVLAEAVVGAVSGVLSETGRDLLRETLSSGAGRGGATVAGVGVLLWSGLRVFRGLTLAFATVYGTADETTFLDQLRNAAFALFALGMAGSAVALGTVVLSRTGVPLVGIVGTVGITLALAIVLLPMYVVVPDVPVGIREAVPGTITAAVGWSLLSVLFRIYAANAGQFDVYGVVGGVLLFVTWLYFGASILLLGAVVNAVLAGRDRQLQLEGDPRRSQPLTMTGTDGTAGDGPDDDGDETERPDAPDDDGDETERPDAPDDAADARNVGRGDVADPGHGGTRTDDTDAKIEELRAEIDRLEAEIDDRTVHREDVESDLRRYVRRRVRRGHARGWGPYLVLLYGTLMTLGAFYFLGDGLAVLAMLVIWLSTLGLYALMVLLGLTFKLVGTPGRFLDRIRDWRS